MVAITFRQLGTSTGSVRRHRRAGLAAGALLAAAALGGCGGETPSGSDAEGSAGADTTGSATATPSTATDSTTAEPSPSSTPAGDSGRTVPIYFVGDTPQGPRLYREFQRVGADQPLAEALDRLAAGEANDPDYKTLVPGGEVVEVDVESETENVIDIVLPAGSPWLDRGRLSEPEARLAAQSVVYTVQGGAQVRYPVRVTVEGSDRPTTLFGIDTSGGVKAGPQLETLALVNVTSPEEGATVSGRFTAEGVASSFEATVPWQVRDSSGAVVKQGHAMAEGWMDRLYPWRTQVDVSGLAPGDYTFVALTDDPSGGEEGAGPHEDTKRITVR